MALSKHNEVSVARNDSAGEEQGGRLLSKDFANSPLHRFRVAGSRNFQNITNPSATLHVSNLPATATEDEVRARFEPHGTLLSVRFLQRYVPCAARRTSPILSSHISIPCSKNSETTRQMCLVKYQTIEEAVGALVNMHNANFNDDLHLRVSFAKTEG